MSEVTTLGDVERLCWRLSGWQVEQRDVDALLMVVGAYAQGTGLPPEAVHGAPVQAPAVATEIPCEAPPAPGPVPEVIDPVAVLQAGVQSLDLEGSYVVTVTRRKLPSALDQYLPDPEERTRTCRKCGATHPIAMFSRDRKSPRGRKSACTPCENIRRRDAERARKARQAGTA